MDIAKIISEASRLEVPMVRPLTKSLKYIFLKDFTVTPPDAKIPPVTIRKGTVVDGVVVDNGQPEVDVMPTVQISYLNRKYNFGIGGRGQQIIAPYTAQTFADTQPKYIFTKDFMAYRTDLGATIHTEEYIAPKQFKKGDIVSGREAKHLVTGQTRILVGKLDVTDAVVPYKEVGAASTSAATIKSSINNIPTPVKALLGLAFILLLLKWQKII